MSLKKCVKTGLKMSMKTILKISRTMSLKMTHHDWDDVKVDKHREGSEGNTVKAVKVKLL
ncbi:hypothetical protein KY285_030413 [Solanum tuberosum]|nr:hypothetical protein KY285_030413 [Solanum tuberosum]